MFWWYQQYNILYIKQQVGYHDKGKKFLVIWCLAIE